MVVEFVGRGRRIDLFSQAENIGLSRMEQPKTRRTYAAHGSVPLADGRRGRILSHTVWAAIALGLGAIVAAGTPDICRAASAEIHQAPDAPSVVASADLPSSLVE